MNISKLGSAVLSMMLLSSATFAQDAPQGPPPPLVQVDAVKSEFIAQQVWVSGTVLSQTDSELAAEVSGKITWMAEVGTRVNQGEALVILDDRRLKIALGQDKANITKWESRVKMLEKRRDRFSSMEALQNTSKDQLDEIVSELEIAIAERDQAELSYDLTAYQIEQSRVVAPFDALVVERIQSPGEFTGVGQTLVRVVNPSQVEASVRAPLSVIPFIESGMEVTVKDKYFSAIEMVKSIVPVGNANSRMMEIRVALQPNDFAIGSAVRVALPHSKSHLGKTVSRDALVLRKSGTFVFQVDENLEAKKVMVTTGVGAGARIEVFGDLSENGKVVVRGAERLRPGQKVRVEHKDMQFTAEATPSASVSGV